METDTITEVDDDDIYFKSAATDRSISVGRGYGNNDPVGYTNDKEITTASQRAGINNL